MRPRVAVAVAATALVGAGTAALAAGRYVSGFALKPSVAGPQPEGLIAVREAGKDTIVLTRTAASARHGVYGLVGIDTHATVGDVIEQEQYAVTRRLTRVQRGEIAPGGFVRMSAQAYCGDPGRAFGLDFTDVEVPGELGPLPAWYLPGARSTWVISVHGLGTTREQALNVVPVLHRFRFQHLVLGYRNDPGAPASPDGLDHLGDTEWHDLDAAMQYAADNGAKRIVLYGWSTGATMALWALDRSPVRGRVAGLVLDSPVLDWRSTVKAAVTSRGLPSALRPLAVRAAEGRAGLQAARQTDAAAPPDPVKPTLIVHGPDDTFASWDASRALAARHPDRTAFHEVPGAPHAAMWNADPKGYEEALRRFLTPLM
ncbi:alpha/beta hydrolase [Actinacidiphila acididurans]|uniref:Alpha/beta hydrolase n=1 Tax=Actinacidiphila acididurans TaxID=2784346 RepID=A0ABS2TQR3_9ACTN|nr:alpha/beta hydrolase [Actinacidiphila acididurans]MBM9505674.1 alpha/beta hydrolase [Actinacidiphila acididurans]